MIDHVSLIVSKIAVSKTFYSAALGALGYGVMMEFPVGEHGSAVAGLGELVTGKPDFWLAEGKPSTTNHVAFSAKSQAEVRAFYEAALAAGGRDNGAPGLRPQYHPDYYGAFVLDPDGHNVEAVCHAPGA
jgi:catechol 2,3-dioxygenase-like lactoylglutathione lyase family enzyme